MVQSVNWLVPGLMLLAVAGFSSLGRWQLDRAEVNRVIGNAFGTAVNLPVLARPVTADEVDARRYRLIRLAGRYDSRRQILLDNMTSRGQAGFHVLTPFRLSDGRLVLVNRGFVPALADRSTLPPVPQPADVDAVVGRIDRLPRAALELEGEPPATDAPLAVLSFPDFDAIEAVLGREVLPFQILLDPAAPSGFGREWAPPEGRADRNIAYAVQWFGLAALAFALGSGSVVRDIARRRGAGQ